MRNAIINGTGSYLPKKTVSNYALEEKLDTSHDWIVTRTGISSRHIASVDETTAFMAAEAAKNALQSSTIEANDIDLILVATCTPSHFFPGMACHVQKALGITKPIPAFDIGAACSGFIYAMDVAKQYIQAGNAQNVLVIGSETMSRALDWTDRSTCILFGDGAGALILTASENPGILSSVIHSSFDSNALLMYPNTFTDSTHTSGQISMRGNEVFKLAVNIMGDVVDEVLQASQLTQADITWLIPHQANIRIIQAIAKKLSMPLEQVVITVGEHANTSAASIPLALDFAIRSNRIKRGDLLLLESFGGGMTWGANLVRY